MMGVVKVCGDALRKLQWRRGLRAGVVTFFDELGPDNVFIYKTSGDPKGIVAFNVQELP